MSYLAKFKKTIILFDIDRTLIDILPIQVEAFYNVFWRKYKVKTTLTDVEYAGVPFNKIVEDLIKLKISISPTQNEINKVVYEIFKENKRIADKKNITALPGAKELLEKLQNEKDYYFGILTGNTKEFAKMWLEKIKLIDYFPKDTWSLGTEWSDRGEGVLIGIKRCENYYGIKFNFAIIAGDSDKEVKAAIYAREKLDIPVYSVAVATGDHTFQTLEQLGADLVFENFSDYNEVAEKIKELKKYSAKDHLIL